MAQSSSRDTYCLESQSIPFISTFCKITYQIFSYQSEGTICESFRILATFYTSLLQINFIIFMVDEAISTEILLPLQLEVWLSFTFSPAWLSFCHIAGHKKRQSIGVAFVFNLIIFFSIIFILFTVIIAVFIIVIFELWL